jgi:hypothetical protein
MLNINDPLGFVFGVKQTRRSRMKKFLMAVMVLGAVFATYGCGEKSTEDKAKDATVEAKDAAVDAKDAAVEAKDDAAKKLDEVGK